MRTKSRSSSAVVAVNLPSAHLPAVTLPAAWRPASLALAVSCALLATPVLAATASGVEHSANHTAAYADDSAIERLEVSGSRSQGYLVKESAGATKLDLSLHDTPQAITVLSAQQLDDFRLTDINKALDLATGVNVERIETDRTYYNARGFDITSFQVDGLGLPFSTGGMEGDLDTAVYERIEIIRGANGLMSGVGNPSATVNMLRKRATSGETTGSLSASYGSWADRRVDGDVQGALDERLRVRAVAVQHNKNSYLDRYSHAKTLGYLTATADFTEQTQLTVGHSAQNSQGNGNLWGALNLHYGNGVRIPYQRSDSTSADWSYWQVKDNRSFVELAQQLNNDWRLVASYQHMLVNQDSDLFYVYVAAAHGIDPVTGAGSTGYGSHYVKDETTQTADLYLQGKVSLAGREHELVSGVSQAKRDYTDVSLYDYSTGAGFPPIANPLQWQGKAAKPVFADGKAGGTVDADQRGLYTVLRWDLADSLKLITGARWIDAKVNGEAYGVDQSTKDSGLVPYAGAVWSLTPTLNLYASHTAIFQPQKERDINKRLLPALDGKALELGLKANLFDERALLTLAWFDIQQQNLAVSAGKVLDPVAGLIEVYKAADGIDSQGVELELAGQVSEQLQLSGSFTQIDISGNETVKNYTPEQVAKLAAVWQPSLLSGLSVGLNYRWQAAISRDQGVVSAPYANAGEAIVTQQAAYGLLGLFARYQFNPAWQIQLNANNLTDESYLNSLYWAQAYYGAPANYQLTLNYRF